ncbi:hypothetical protein A1O3_05383 [Capronia epimyces CBS 606.96]|uniref:tRNA(Phe) (4-demethylwyosine(37)-C(7)) aminocarboxypropyltransferase n=1 Tax=Capronia epimyces CBS 606.96 TaxID=1182542 RepID=W9XWU7_9EURO|nr:uncharacterized protein A1O3_05383 [Capronia epimyces CBS 606.96]EXJ84713.1 hypothetical protein A1O3_05383 [Capronia epimyces CBS 606.96]
MDNRSHDTTQSPRGHRPKKPANPLVKGILAFCTRHDIEVIQSAARGDSHNAVEPAYGYIGEPDTAPENAPNPDTLPCDLSRPSRPSRTLPRSDIPKRYTIYGSLVLLSANFCTQNPRWAELYNGLSDTERTDLFGCIAEQGFAASGAGLEQNGIRVAIGAPIAAEETDLDDRELSTATESEISTSTSSPPPGSGPASTTTEVEESQPPTRKQNVLRSPSGLVPVYGDWGFLRRTRDDDTSWDSGIGDGKQKIANPSRRDFEEAFWTSTSQHKGITQCWAPLYTMFSRGNVSEKARILGLSPSAPNGTQTESKLQSESRSTSHTPYGSMARLQSQFPGLTLPEIGVPLSSIDVVDFYVGIGYFAFCYLARGVRRVWGWDINPWSIEGLRRGCEKNGWDCLVVRVRENGELALIRGTKSGREDRSDGENVVREVVARISQGDNAGAKPEEYGQQTAVRCVAFLGDNKWSDKVMGEIQRELRLQGLSLNVKHANLGLLPTSRGSWENAVKVIKGDRRRVHGRSGGWLHVHENVDIRHIEAMKNQIVQELIGIAHVGSERADGPETPWSVSCDHIHHVKTYAPGVMHCVFDIHITPNG